MTEGRTNLGEMLRCFMAMERWSMRKLAPKIGISAPTLLEAYKQDVRVPGTYVEQQERLEIKT